MKGIAFLGVAGIAVAALPLCIRPADAQLVDRVMTPNAAGEGIAKAPDEKVSADRGEWRTGLFTRPHSTHRGTL